MAPTITNQSPTGTFQLTVANVGRDAAREVRITATLPRNLVFAGSKPEASVRETTVFWSVPEIRPRESMKFFVSGKLRGRLKPRERYTGRPTVRVTYLDSQGGQHRYPPGN